LSRVTIAGLVRPESRYSGDVAGPGKKIAESAEEWLLEGPDSTASGEREPIVEAGKDATPEVPGGGDGEAIRAETAQWIVEPAADRNGQREASPQAPATERAESAQLKPSEGPKLEAGRSKRVSSKQLRKAEEALGAVRTENGELAKRLRELQTELRRQAKRANAFEERQAQLRGRIEELESALAEATKRAPAKGRAPAKRRSATARRKTTTSTAAKAGTSARTTKAAKPRKRKTTTSRAGKMDLNSATFEELRSLGGLSVTQSARLIAYRDVRGGYESLAELDDIPGLSRETRTHLRAQLTL
jgi:DNA uptake protein ComE-like DNA-binding protein